MRINTIVVTIAFVVAVPLALCAQPSADRLSTNQIAVACAPPPTTTVAGSSALHVIGSQDTVPRTVFSERDLLVIDGGTAKGLQLGQTFFVRRPVLASAYKATANRLSVRTIAWIRLVAANESTSIATVERPCDFIQLGDYLEPFAMPAVPPEATEVDRSGELDFSAMGRVLSGEDDRLTASVGAFVLIDRGADQGLAPGARFAIYRDVQMWMRDAAGQATAQLPLTSIGEGVVITISPRMSVVRILAARDAVQRGDFVVPRKK